MPNQSMILPNVLNEEMLENLKNPDSSNNFSSRMKRKMRKQTRQALRCQVANGAIGNSDDELQQQKHNGWDHGPVMNLPQPDSQRRFRSRNFQNSLRYRSETYNKHIENGRRSENLTQNEVLNSLSDLFYANVKTEDANGAIDNLADALQQQNHHGWDHVPVRNLPQPSSQRRFRSRKFRNSSRYRSETYNKHIENGPRSRNFTLNEVSNSLSDLFYAKLKTEDSNGAIDNSADVLQQQNHHGCDHVSVMNLSQPDSQRRFRSRNFQNSLRYRSETYNKHIENGPRSQNLTLDKVLNFLSDLFYAKVTTKDAASNENFESWNPSLKHSEESVSDVVNNKNKPGIMQKASNSTISNAPDIKDDDIEYLFTVDPSSEFGMVVEIDLQSEGINVIPNSEAANLIQKSKAGDVTADMSIMVGNSIVPAKSRKRKLSNHDKKINKRLNQPQCTICGICYDDVIKRQQQMLFSNCNHTFCLPCVTKDGASKVCPACGDKFLSFRRLFCD